MAGRWLLNVFSKFRDDHNHWCRWRERAQFLDQLIDSTPDGFILQQNGGILAANRAGLKMLGADTLDRVFGQSILQFLSPGSIEGGVPAAGRAIQAGESGTFGSQWIRGMDGQQRRARIELSPSFIDDAPVLLIVLREEPRAESLPMAEDSSADRACPVTTAIEAERARIARDLHDDLGSTLTASKLDLAWLQKRIQAHAAADTEVIETLGQMMDSINETLEKVKHLSAELRVPPILQQRGLAAAMESHLRQFLGRTRILGRLRVDESIELEPAVALGIFRIFQEALTNIARHSGATEVWVSLERIQGNLTMTVRDNGCGIRRGSLDNPQSAGLNSMCERARLLSGDVSISADGDAGTRVTLVIPRSEEGPGYGDSI